MKISSDPTYVNLQDIDRADWEKNIPIMHLNKGYYEDNYNFLISNQRDVSDETYDRMPGFRFTWNYNKQLVPDVIEKHSGSTRWESYFVRLYVPLEGLPFSQKYGSCGSYV